MNKNTKKIDRGLYAGTYKYYAKYRPGVPNEVINVIIKHFNIKPSDRILDIGCGTGQVVLAMEGKCREIVCIDPDPKMIRWAKKITKNSKTKLTWINCGAEDLGKLKEKLGVFKIATFCRSFHWIKRPEYVLKELDTLIDANGGIAIFGDGSFWTGKEKWQLSIKKIIQRYLGKKRRAGKERFKTSTEPWETILARSVFRFVKTYDISVVRMWDVESIIGYLFSTSFAAPYLFGDQLDKFKEEIKNTLLSINPKGVFQENAVWSMVLGSKKPHQ